MHNEKQSWTSRLANAGLLVRAAVAEMTGRDVQERSYGLNGAVNAIRARFGMYKDISTFDISRTSYAMARAIFYANLYKDRKTGNEYGKEYLLGAPFGKPIVNIAAGFAVGSPIQITQSNEITEDDDTPEDEEELDENGNPVITDSQDLAEAPTIANVNRMLQDRRDAIFKTVRNSYRDGDFFIAVEDDGEFTLLPPEDVDVITNPSNPDSIDGYDIWTSFPDPSDPTGATVITYVDEIRRTYRERMVIDKQNKRTPVPGTRQDYRSIEDGGLEERELPIVHFANEQEARSLYGVSEFQNLYFLMANYHAILSAAIKGNIYNSTSVPVIQGVKNMKQFLSQNFQQDKDGNYMLKWDNQKMLVVGEGGSVQMLQANGTAADASTLLEILFYLICQTSETPEFAFGTAVKSSKASVSEQTPMLIKKAIRKQGELEKPLRKLIELYISRMATIRPEEFDAELEFTISMPEILDEDLNINIQIVNALLEKGIITEETAMLMLNLGKYVKNFSEERKKAQAQKQARNPIPTDVFGQPVQSQDDEDEQINQAKNEEIKEMLKHPETKHVAEMLSKNINALTLEQIQEMNPHRGSEGKNPKAVQESKTVSVKSGNPYRDGSGRFGTGPGKQAGNEEAAAVGKGAFDIPDDYIYHTSGASVDSFKKDGIKPSESDLFGSAVYFSKTSGGQSGTKDTQLRVRSSELIADFGAAKTSAGPTGEWTTPVRGDIPKKFFNKRGLTSSSDREDELQIPRTILPKYIQYYDGKQWRSITDDAIQETKAISVKSGNPYRDGNGRFGSGKSIAGAETKEEERRRRRRERRQARKAKALAAASETSDKLDYDSLEKAAERHKAALTKPASTSDNTEAKRMQAFVKELGYDGKATPISKESKGDIEIYRGWAKESYASEYLSGKSLRLSDGLEGSGQYFAASKFGAERYIQFTGGHLSKQFISKSAKIISADDITDQRWKFSESISKTLQSQREFIRDLPKAKQSSALSRFKQTEKFIVWLTTDNGAFAAYMGYQAIDVKLRGDYLVLDRSIVRYIKD